MISMILSDMFEILDEIHREATLKELIRLTLIQVPNIFDISLDCLTQV